MKITGITTLVIAHDFIMELPEAKGGKQLGKRVKGIIKGCQVPDPTKTGYRDVWDMGRAADTKKKWKVQGPNRPSI